MYGAYKFEVSFLLLSNRFCFTFKINKKYTFWSLFVYKMYVINAFEIGVRYLSFLGNMRVLAPILDRTDPYMYQISGPLLKLIHIKLYEFIIIINLSPKFFIFVKILKFVLKMQQKN